MSPDETAMAVAAANMAVSGSVLFPANLPPQFNWVHPRSWVYVQDKQTIAPIGFLGLPAILSPIYAKLGILGMNLFTPFFALVTLFALWRILPRGWPRAAKFATLAAWMSFPMVVLYANRGLFAQLPVTCLAVWMWWGLSGVGSNEYGKEKAGNDVLVGGGKGWIAGLRRAWVRIRLFGGWAWFKPALSGVALGCALSIRPVEAVWLVPVAVCAYMFGRSMNPAPQKKTIAIDLFRFSVFLLPVLAVVAYGAWLGHATYGAWLVSGYQIRPTAQAIASTTDVVVVQPARNAGLLQVLPFDFHPRSVIWNVRHYLMTVLWPWLAVVVFALAYFINGWFAARRGTDRVSLRFGQINWAILAMVWTGGWLVFFYGNGIYQDNVRLNEIGVGNSFLRYLLPISVVFAVCVGLVFQRLWNRWPLRALAVCGVVALSALGLWTALGRDAEGILANERETARYAEIRTAGRAAFGDGGVVLSDRSDKIFFPSIMAVSPMPDDARIVELLSAGMRVGMLATTQDQKGLDAWNGRSFLLTPLYTNANQTLYDVSVK